METKFPFAHTLLKAQCTLVICTIDGIETHVCKIGIEGTRLIPFAMHARIRMIRWVSEFEFIGSIAELCPVGEGQ